MSSCDVSQFSSEIGVRIAYGVRGNELLYVGDVPRGLACECICVACRMPLLARKGIHRRPHFAHAHNTSCDGGVETILHRLAKEVFRDIKTIALPEYRYVRKHSIGRVREVLYSEVIARTKSVPENGLRIESRLGQLVPDIMVHTPDGDMVIEIAVTHRVESQKLSSLREHTMPVIEIRLDESDAFLSREELRIKLANERGCKHWLFHPQERQHEQAFRRAVNDAERDEFSRRAERDRLDREALAASMQVRTQASRSHTLRRSLQGQTETWVNQFYRTHGRYPSLNECLAFHDRRRKT